MADTIAVMYLGRVVESGSARAIFKNPIHPYTKGLLKSMPVLGNKSSERLHAIEGNVPVPLDPPDECGFCSRCQEKQRHVRAVSLRWLRWSRIIWSDVFIIRGNRGCPGQRNGGKDAESIVGDNWAEEILSD